MVLYAVSESTLCSEYIYVHMHLLIVSINLDKTYCQVNYLVFLSCCILSANGPESEKTMTSPLDRVVIDTKFMPKRCKFTLSIFAEMD